MKKCILFMVFGLVLSSVYAQNSVPPAGMEISFVYNRQRSLPSNQFAVWVEDSRGSFVKTLYATRFTATGAWAKRPLAIPTWVKKSGVSSLAKSEIDTFTGATPRTGGALSYSWDGKDKNGNPAAPGEYRVFLEATLRNENRVLYSAAFGLGNASPAGSPVEAEVKTEYFGRRTTGRGMIDRVKVLYRR